MNSHLQLQASLSIEKYPSIATYGVPVFDFNRFIHLSYKDQQAVLIEAF